MPCSVWGKKDSDYNEGRQSLNLLVVQTSAEVVLWPHAPYILQSFMPISHNRWAIIWN